MNVSGRSMVERFGHEARIGEIDVAALQDQNGAGTARLAVVELRTLVGKRLAQALDSLRFQILAIGDDTEGAETPR